MYRNNKNINLAIVSDSSTLRVLLGKSLGLKGFSVCTAGSIAELQEILQSCKPLLLLLDENFTGNSVQASKEIKKHFSGKILLLSRKSPAVNDNSRGNYIALADDAFLNTGLSASAFNLILPQLVKKVHKLLLPQTETKQSRPGRFICIGSSTGGTVAIEEIVRSLPEDFKDILLIAQHFPTGFSLPFSKRLNGLTSLRVVQGSYGMTLKPGMVVISPDDFHMLVKSNARRPNTYQLQLKKPLPGEYNVPSADLLMQSVADNCAARAVGVVLSGMGNDGTKGISYIAMSGGIAIAQNFESSQAYGMPGSAISSGHVQKVMSLSEIVNFISFGLNSTLA